MRMSSSSLKIIYGLAFQAYGLLFYLLARIFFRIRIYGQEKILSWEKQNNLGSVFVSRHWSCWDPVLLAAGFWKLQFEHIFQYTKIKYVAKDNLTVLFKCIPCLTSYVIFVNQRNTKKSTVREIIDLIKQNISVVIFPEGTVVPEDKKVGGLVSLVIELVEKTTNQKIAVFPLKIEAEGPYGKPNGNWLGYLLRKVRIKVKIGDSVSLKDLEEMISKKAVLNKHRREKIVEELLNLADRI